MQFVLQSMRGIRDDRRNSPGGWPLISDIFSGFLIVAACVMTFEARDNAAKVVPATTGNNVEEENHRRNSLKVP